MRNLIELLNGFYDLNIPNQINPSSSFLFITLLRKFNGTKNKANGEYFPEVLPIYNNELSHLTGIEDRSLRRSRKELTTFRLIESDDTTWILKYESKGTKNSGIYTINYELLLLFDYGQFGNGYVPNTKSITDKLVTEIAQFRQKADKSSTNLSVINNKETVSKPAPNNTEIENGKFLAFKLNETKHNIISSPGPGPGPGTEQLSEKNDDDIVAYAKEIADKKEEFSEQVFGIQKKLIARYSLNGWNKPPTPQFIKELIKINEAYGGFEYIMNKIDQMPIPLEPTEIGKVLRSWCQHPEKGGGNVKKPKLDIDPVKVEIEKEKEQLGDALVACKDKDEFWKLLKIGVEISSMPNPVEYLFNAYKPERIKLDAKEDFEWFTEYCKGVERS